MNAEWSSELTMRASGGHVSRSAKAASAHKVWAGEAKQGGGKCQLGTAVRF